MTEGKINAELLKELRFKNVKPSLETFSKGTGVTEEFKKCMNICYLWFYFSLIIFGKLRLQIIVQVRKGTSLMK